MTIDEEILEDGDGILGLPKKFADWRPHQAEIMSRIVTDLVSTKDFVVLELPTGSGKTMISMAVRQVIDTKTLYVCTTKTLQEQFLTDFPHAKLIKGRSNYACGHKLEKFPDITADDCPAKKCLLSCPYNTAKREAQRATLCVMNMAYFLAEVQHVGSFKGRGLVVIDEADTLEDALLDQVSVQISAADIDSLGLGRPEFKTKFESWQRWAEAAKETIQEELRGLEAEIKKQGFDDGDEEDWSTAPLVLLRKKKRLERMAAKLGFFLKNVDQYWVFEETAGAGFNVSGKPYSTRFTFKPVRVDQFGDIVFTAGQKFILMSATILDSFQYERNVGLAKYREVEKVAFHKLGSVFDPERRPVIIKDGIDLTYKNKEAGLRLLPNEIRNIFRLHPNEKGVIHAVTYEIASLIQRNFPERVLVHSPATRREVIERFKASDQPLVLVSPSIERGEDFPDELCRFIVVAKIPYPYLGDERIKRRLHHKDGQKWYTLRTISKIVQMTGRGMRHEADSCTSYIIDSGFRKLYLANQRMFPQWWRDALVWESLQGRKGGGTVASKEGQKKVAASISEDHDGRDGDEENAWPGS